MADSSGLLGYNGDTKFYDAQDRLNFVRKVYSILGLQILITSLITLIPLTNDHAKQWMHDNYGLLIACCIGSIVISCAMVCFLQLTRTVPYNYVMLGLFTLCESYLVASCAAVSDPQAVVAAAFSTAAIVIGITVLVHFVKTDFTFLGPIILIIGMQMAMLSIFIFFFHFKALHMVYCSLAVVLFSFYLIFDTQLIMGGKRYQVEIDDYILGAFILYTDIVKLNKILFRNLSFILTRFMIFLYLLRIFSGR